MRENLQLGPTGARLQTPPGARSGRWDWPRGTPAAAAVWSLAYAGLGLFWSLGGPGYPYWSGPDHQGPSLSILGDLPPASVSPIVATWGLVGVAAAGLMARGVRQHAVRGALLVFAGVTSATLALLVPDYRVLVFVAYAPVVVLGAPFGWPPGTNILALVTWPLLNQLLCIAGGVLWGAAAVAYARQTRGACVSCGRRLGRGGGSARNRWWGRPAVVVAIAVPLIYATTRFIWALGLPLGINEALYREGQAIGLWGFGAGLGMVAVAGALLTLGLVQSWGEVFPRWLPVIGGRSVPIALAVVPALSAAMLVTNAGLMYWRLVATAGGFRLGEGTVLRLDTDPAAVAPELLWPIWGLALAAAALDYYYRRRGLCARCGQC
jgi:hypothetical protein